MTLKAGLYDAYNATTDVEALREWRSASPALQTLWNVNAPVAQWEGLEFSADFRVVTVRLSSRGLTNVSTAIGKLTALKEFHVADNQLASIPAELGALESLRSLDLRENQLTSLPAKLGALTSLEVLWLTGNQLTSVPAEWEAGGALEKGGGVIVR